MIKFHEDRRLVSEPQIKRTLKLKDNLLSSSNHLCIERAKFFTETYKSNEYLPEILKKAKAISHTLKNMTIFIRDDELLVGNETSKNLGEKLTFELHSFKGFTERSGKFIIKVDKNFKNSLKKVKDSWKKMMRDIKKSDPKYKRYKKLYTKLEKMDSKLSEIEGDTKEIKMKVYEVAFMIEHLMEDIDNIEGYMKENLGSDWVILRNAWQRCKDGEISKAEFIKMGLLKIGKKFASIFIKV